MCKTYRVTATAVFLSFLYFYGCGLTDNDEITNPGRLRIWLSVDSLQNYPAQTADSLEVEVRDFRIFAGENYANVFQHPDQFLPSQDSIVYINLLKDGLNKKFIQVCYGSIPPLEYDRLLFLLSPSDELILGGKRYPIRSTGENTKTLIDMNKSIIIKENKTTDLYIRINFEKTVYRLLDEFVFEVNIKESWLESE